MFGGRGHSSVEGLLVKAGRRIRGGVIIAEEEEASFHTVGAVAFMLALCPDGTGC